MNHMCVLCCRATLLVYIINKFITSHHHKPRPVVVVRAPDSLRRVLGSILLLSLFFKLVFFPCAGPPDAELLAQDGLMLGLPGLLAQHNRRGREPVKKKDEGVGGG